MKDELSVALVRPRLDGVRIVVGILLFCPLIGPQAWAVPNSCTLTATKVKTACDGTAQADYTLARAICENVTGAAAQACREAAAADLRDAKDACREQSQARQAACQKLGQAPYDPVINDFYLNSFAQREATLRQLNTALPQGVRLNSF